MRRRPLLHYWRETRRSVRVRWRPEYLDHTVEIECEPKHAARILKALRAEFRGEKLADEKARRAAMKAHKREVAAMRAARLKARRARR